MTRIVAPKVVLVGRTEFIPPDVPWNTDVVGGEALVEFAGRACYQSWNKPNPATATNAGYIAHILDVAHFSVIEHATASFYVTGVSRAFTHELVRHRHLSFSQLSQRYVDMTNADWTAPKILQGEDDDASWSAYLEAARTSQASYVDLVAALEASGGNYSRKQIREAARAVMLNAVETKIVVTGNYRAWRHFLDMRATYAADAEMCEVACLIGDELMKLAPSVFDYTEGWVDGRRVLHSRTQEKS